MNASLVLKETVLESGAEVAQWRCGADSSGTLCAWTVWRSVFRLYDRFRLDRSPRRSAARHTLSSPLSFRHSDRLAGKAAWRLKP